VTAGDALIRMDPLTDSSSSIGERRGQGVSDVILRARGLAKRYGTTDAVRDLNLEVRRGETYGFLGPNGAGKTTTLLMLLGIERPTAGTIERFGQTGPIDPFRDKTRIGVVGEQQYLYDDLSAWEYLQFFGSLYRVEQPERRAQDLLERLDLYEFRQLRARDFSRGMQQKLGLARALLHGPELLVLDEPVSGLDPHGRRQAREILAEENRRGVTILLSSHILSEVERTADRVGILYGGRLVAEDDVASLSARLEPDPVLEIDVERLAPGTVEVLREQPFVREAELTDAGLLRVRVASDGDYRREVSEIVGRQGGLITGMRQERLSLEDAFVRLTQEVTLTPQPPLHRNGEGEQDAVSEIAAGVGVTDDKTIPVGVTVVPADHVSPLHRNGEELGAVGIEGPHGRLEGEPSAGVLRRWRTVWVIARRDLLSMLYSPGAYLVVALGMLATLPVIAGYLDAVERNHLLILADAFTLPFFVAATLAMLFLALASVATIARERDQGTLEVLFYGPVDAPAYVLAKHLAHLLVYLPIGVGLAVLMLAYAGMTGLRLPQAFVLELVLSVFTAAAVAAFGVCLSTLARGVRAGIGLLGALTVLFLAIRGASELLSGLTMTNTAGPLLLVRNVVLALDVAAGYVSPFSLFQRGVDALVRQDLGAYGLAIVLSCLECVVLLAVSVRLLARRGVRR
jgi:ABC-type multidrug transport system ATPase subunit/ABC-type transport system involved in multi-copper enzyme maturation permease subunit